MNRISFTAGRLKDATCTEGKQQVFLWDLDTKGLGLRVTVAGAKAFIYQGKLDGKTIRITIGNPDAWPIESQWGKDADGKRIEVRRGAREEARRLQGLLDQGIDPRRQEAQERQARLDASVAARRQDLLVGDAWDEYLKARRGRWSEGHYQDHLAFSARGGVKKKRGKGLTESGPIAALLPLKLVDLDANALSSWLEKESKVRPTAAALSYRLMRAFIRWSADSEEYRGLIPDEVYNARKVRDALPRSQTKEGDSLQREQLKAWFNAVRKAANPVASAYLQALLITGARREEMAALCWEDVDFQWRSLRLRDKVDGTRVIPLTPYLHSLLSALPRRSEWVFSSPTAKGGRIAEPRYAHLTAIETAGLPHLSIHGLRRSFGTLCEWVEVPAGVSAQIMGHKPSALAEKHYRRRPLDLLRVWHDKIEAWMLNQAGVDFAPTEAKLRVVTTA